MTGSRAWWEGEPRARPTDVVLTAAAGDDDPSAEASPVRTQFGRAINVPSATGIYSDVPTPPVDLVAAEFREPKACTLLVQATQTAGPLPGKSVLPDSLRLVVTSLLSGGGTLVRTLPIQASIPRSLRVYGRSIDVAVSNGSSATWRVTGAIVEGVAAAPEVHATWVPSGVAGAHGIVASLPGVLLKAQGFLASAGSSSSYTLQFFDVAGLPVNGAVPILELGPLVAAQPAPFSVADDASPAIFFQQGLAWALSTTPGTLTLGDGTARVDVGWGA